MYNLDIIFFRGINWEELAQTTPYMTKNPSSAPVNLILKFFLSSFLFLAIGIVMLG